MHFYFLFLVFSAMTMAKYRELKSLRIWRPNSMSVHLHPGESTDFAFEAELNYKPLSWVFIKKHVSNTRFQFYLSDHNAVRQKSHYASYRELFELGSKCSGEKIGRGKFKIYCTPHLKLKSVLPSGLPPVVKTELYLDLKDTELGQSFYSTKLENFVITVDTAGIRDRFQLNNLPPILEAVNAVNKRQSGYKTNDDLTTNLLLMNAALDTNPTFNSGPSGHHHHRHHHHHNNHGSTNSHRHDHGSSYNHGSGHNHGSSYNSHNNHGHGSSYNHHTSHDHGSSYNHHTTAHHDYGSTFHHDFGSSMSHHSGF